MSIKLTLKTISKVVCALTAAALLSLTVNYYRTRNTIETCNKNGQITYTHSDPRTTHLLNYWTGEELLTPEERLEVLQEGFANVCTLREMSCPDFSRMNESQFTEWFYQTFPPTARHEEKKTTSLDDLLVNSGLPFPLQREYDPVLYQKLWQIAAESGAPSLRWTLGEFLIDSIAPEGYFDAYQNTIHVHPFINPKTLVAEFAHAKQAEEDPIQYSIGLLQTGWRVATRIVLKSMTLDRAYMLEYRTPGSIEYEAHHIIEPELLKKYNLTEPPVARK